MDFAFPADHRVKIKESKKIDKYQNLARELKMMVIPIIIDALETIFKGLEIRRRVEIIQTSALLRSARILRRVLRDRPEETSCCSDSMAKQPVKMSIKILQGKSKLYKITTIVCGEDLSNNQKFVSRYKYLNSDIDI